MPHKILLPEIDVGDVTFLDTVMVLAALVPQEPALNSLIVPEIKDGLALT